MSASIATLIRSPFRNMCATDTDTIRETNVETDGRSDIQRTNCDDTVSRISERASNCVDCPRHAVVPDPDPTDWFCEDDVAVLCGLAENPKDDPSKSWKYGVVWPNRAVTVSCRPYNVRKECVAPDWCPLGR